MFAFLFYREDIWLSTDCIWGRRNSLQRNRKYLFGDSQNVQNKSQNVQDDSQIVQYEPFFCIYPSESPISCISSSM